MNIVETPAVSLNLGRVVGVLLKNDIVHIIACQGKAETVLEDDVAEIRTAFVENIVVTN